MEKSMHSISINLLLHFSLLVGQNQSLWNVMTANKVFCKSTVSLEGVFEHEQERQIHIHSKDLF